MHAFELDIPSILPSRSNVRVLSMRPRAPDPAIAIVPRLETERLVLRPFVAADFDALADLLARPEMFDMSERGPMSREEAWTRLLRHLGQWSLSGYGIFAILDRSDGRFIGETGESDFRRAFGPDFDPFPEATWSICPSRQGQGLATEAAAAALAWCEAEAGASASVCTINIENAPSLRVAEKLDYRAFGERKYKGYRTRLFKRDA